MATTSGHKRSEIAVINPNYVETLDDFEIDEDEDWDEMVSRHVQACKEVEYCKICAEY